MTHSLIWSLGLEVCCLHREQGRSATVAARAAERPIWRGGVRDQPQTREDSKEKGTGAIASSHGVAKQVNSRFSWVVTDWSGPGAGSRTGGRMWWSPAASPSARSNPAGRRPPQQQQRPPQRRPPPRRRVRAGLPVQRAAASVVAAAGGGVGVWHRRSWGPSCWGSCNGGAARRGAVCLHFNQHMSFPPHRKCKYTLLDILQ
jgi:hypothetical protein